MNKESFQFLLEDLYDKYNHTKKGDIPFLVENYNGKEFDALKTFYFKYNYKSSIHYDPKAGTDTHIKNLIEDYSKGFRTIRDKQPETTPEEENLAAIQKGIEEANNSINTVSDNKKEELENLANNKVKLIEEMISEKEKYFAKLVSDIEEVIQQKTKQLEALANNAVPEIVKPQHDNVELKINIDFEESNMEMPEEIHSMAVGTRFLIKGQEKGKDVLLAFEIKEIFCDYVSTPGKCVKQIDISRI